MMTIDATGAALRLDAPPGRIVSLVPSLTEALFALGAGDRVVGVTRFCEEPAPAVASLSKVGGTKTPDISAIVALRPDLVIASTEENQEADVVALRQAGISVYVTFFPTVAAALDGLGEIADIVRAEPERQLWLAAARHLVATFAQRGGPSVPYFCPIWRRPSMVARRDTYMSDLLALAGGRSVFPDDGPAHYYAVELGELARLAPAVILLPDEPYRFAPRHLSDFEPDAGVPAVAAGRIHFVDGKALSWYGPRTAAALDEFSRLFDAVRDSLFAEGIDHGR